MKYIVTLRVFFKCELYNVYPEIRVLKPKCLTIQDGTFRITWTSKKLIRSLEYLEVNLTAGWHLLIWSMNSWSLSSPYHKYIVNLPPPYFWLPYSCVKKLFFKFTNKKYRIWGNISSSFLRTALLREVDVGTNLTPLDRRETSDTYKDCDERFMFSETNLPTKSHPLFYESILTM